MKRKSLQFGLAIACALVLMGIGWAIGTIVHLEKRVGIGWVESVTSKGFYELSDEDKKPAIPGTLVRAQRLYSAPDAVTGWRILYHSTDKDGSDIVVSGLVAVPSTASTSKRSVVAWGHPTTGVVPRCGPSSGVDPFDTIEGLRALIAAGYAVVAPDYSNMGTIGPPSFLIGESEGRTMLDAVRAAQHISEANVGSDVAFWGHSQGGHASLFAAQLAPTYAPELTIRGAALAAPATDLAQLLTNKLDSVSGVTIGSYAFNEYAQAYNLKLDTILTPEGVIQTPQMSRLCLLGQNKELHAIASPMIGSYVKSSPVTTEPWATQINENIPKGAATGIPLFIAQGEKDQLVSPAVTTSFVEQQKGRGVQVTYETYPNATHGTIALDATKSLVSWLNLQFAKK